MFTFWSYALNEKVQAQAYLVGPIQYIILHLHAYMLLLAYVTYMH